MSDCPRNAFVTANLPLMYLMANRATGNTPDRDDLLSEFLLAVLRNFHGFDARKGRPGTWLDWQFRSLLSKRRARRTALCRAGVTLSMQGEAIDLADDRVGDPAAIAERRDLVRWAMARPARGRKRRMVGGNLNPC